MRVVMVGGGSGGHVTPIKYIAEELKNIDQSNEIIYIGPKNDKFNKLIESSSSIDKSKYILTGKFRRYNRSLLQELFDIPTQAKNIIDLFKITLGFFESLIVLVRLKPDVIFSKGSSTSVPVAYASKILRIKFITHDSDHIPGLAHKLAGNHAQLNLVGQKDGVYPYKDEKIKYVGVPISPLFLKKPSKSETELTIKTFDLPDDFILFIGGSLGANKINNAAIDFVKKNKKNLVLISGRNNIKIDGIVNIDFISDVKHFRNIIYLANIVVTRAGATAISELAAAKKACIFIPGEQLADQIVNSEELTKAEAGIVVREYEIEKLDSELSNLINDIKMQKKLEKNIANFTPLNGAEKCAQLIYELGNE